MNLPTRQVSALNGAQFVSLVTSYSFTAREDEIFNQIISGNVPDFQRNLIPIFFTQTISSTTYNVTYYVLSDYLAIGCDTNYFLCPMSPLLAQRICNYAGYSMPTRKMVNQIWTASTVKLAPSTIAPSPQMTTIPVMNDHNTTVWGQRSAVLASHPLGELVGGDKKDVIISNSIYGNPAPGRVVIYGWHQLNGSPIQPLYAGHEETYADYSHGIRLVQNSIMVNGSATTVQAVLQSSTLNTLLSDEGVISIPWYPLSSVPVIATPGSFAVTSESNTSLRLHITNNPLALSYYVQLSSNGISFSDTITLSPANLVVTGLTPDSLYFLRIAAVGASSVSAWSEVLGAVTSSSVPEILIVNGFDRASTGNTYNFIRQHGKAFRVNNYTFNAATNEAVINGLVNLTNYNAVDYILGNESTANETFSTTEQEIVKTYLQNGGYLFVSGAEIAWDLDNMGSASDKEFYNLYLKATYVADAPNSQSNTYYSFEPFAGSIFEALSTMTYDNGTQGTFNVSYPDVITGNDGGQNALQYTGLTDNFSGISFEGIFPNGTQTGKLVSLGFPFETVYPESSRNLLMEKILVFFFPEDTVPLPFVNSPLVYCQNDTAAALVAIGENLLWYYDSLGGSGITEPIVPATNTPGIFNYYVSQTVQGTESSRAQITVEVIAKPAAPALTHIGTQLHSDYSGTNQWYRNGFAISGATNQNYQPDSTGNYFVKALSNGCYSNVLDTFVVEVPEFSGHDMILGHPYYYCDSSHSYFEFNFEPSDTLHHNAFDFYAQQGFSINHNLWEIGQPSKTFFNTPFNGNRSLITDSLHTYALNNFSSFQFRVGYCSTNNPPYDYTVNFFHKLNSTDIKDGGYIEYSIDNGAHWDNIINYSSNPIYFNNFYSANDSIESINDAGFSGTNTDWQHSGFIIYLYQPHFIDIRFVFSSDSLAELMDGWIIENLVIGGTWESVKQNKNINDKISIVPNPVFDVSNIILFSFDDQIKDYFIYNSCGEILKSLKNVNTNSISVNKKDFSSGIYFYKIKTDKNIEFAGKFIVE
ncbi:MAG: hypothetical protein A2275_04070 [Bacteroidetes bacterium RIFOXYA12_FULL_35_11]|nr:MAG: hypothetical protein A2X01_10210 [Bacteroidetes bacterium GWF2_35_48]OFY80998.1 MAG: hypothetical protein A2275_04070 [Bacteroidetes bacterium RIFOXYA12_FULL_35_11]